MKNELMKEGGRERSKAGRNEGRKEDLNEGMKEAVKYGRKVRMNGRRKEAFPINTGAVYSTVYLCGRRQCCRSCRGVAMHI